MEIDPELFAQVRSTFPSEVAKELVGVQPMTAPVDLDALEKALHVLKDLRKGKSCILRESLSGYTE